MSIAAAIGIIQRRTYASERREWITSEGAVVVAMVQPAHNPADALAARLDEPRTAESLNQILDHLDLLALLVTGLSGFVSRGDTIADSLADGVREFSVLEQGSGIDVGELLGAAKQLGAAAPALLEAVPKLLETLPLLDRLLSSGIADPAVIDLGSAVAQAAVAGAGQAYGSSITGIRGLLKALKDPDVSRAVGFVMSIAKSLGQQLDGSPHLPAHSGPS
jgi:hypothetical protein